MYKFQTLIKT